MEQKRSPLMKLVSSLYRYTQFYTDKALKKYQLSSGMYPYLLILHENEGISQNKISKELNVDKAMSARTIKKLIELDYIKKVPDEEDSRAYRLYTTDKAEKVIPEIRREIDNWIKIISRDSQNEFDAAVSFLSNAVINAKEYKAREEEMGD